MKYQFSACGDEMEDFIHEKIREYNRPHFTDYESLSQCILDDTGSCIAGIVADRCGELISVDFLWVDETHRHSGLGAELLNQVEALGRAAGGRRVVLFTFQFQAPDFYPKFGYHLMGRAEGGAKGQSQYYYLKELN